GPVHRDGGPGHPRGPGEPDPAAARHPDRLGGRGRGGRRRDRGGQRQALRRCADRAEPPVGAGPGRQRGPRERLALGAGTRLSAVSQTDSPRTDPDLTKYRSLRDALLWVAGMLLLTYLSS